MISVMCARALVGKLMRRPLKVREKKTGKNVALFSTNT